MLPTLLAVLGVASLLGLRRRLKSSSGAISIRGAKEQDLIELNRREWYRHVDYGTYPVLIEMLLKDS